MDTAADEPGTTLTTSDGRAVRYHDSGPGPQRVLVWHHGTPGTGRLLPPVLAQCAARGIRLICVTRPGYPGSTRLLGRSVADAACDALTVLDALGVERFATAGQSGGGTHALALAALAGERAVAAASFAAVAPYHADDPEWFAGMADPGALRAATRGLAVRSAHAETAEFDESVFIPADWQALDGEWSALGADAQASGAAGAGGEIDDDCAYVFDWGAELASVSAAVLVVQGAADRMVPAGHATRLLRALPDATSWWLADDGHISALRALPQALDWLLEHGLSSPSLSS